MCPGAGSRVDAMCLFLLGGECCSPAQEGTHACMAWHCLPSLNLHCLTAGALLTSILWLRGLFGEEWASLRIRALAGLAEKHRAETTEGEGGGEEEEERKRGAQLQGTPLLCGMAQPQELLADSYPGLPGQAASLIGGKMPPYTSTLLGSTAQFPSPAPAEGLYVPVSFLPAFLIPLLIPLSQLRSLMWSAGCRLYC